MQEYLEEKIISVVVICVFVLNASFIVINSTEHIAANKVDENDGMQIKYLMEEYKIIKLFLASR